MKLRIFIKKLYGSLNDNMEQDLEIQNLLKSISTDPKLKEEDKIRLEGELSEAEMLAVLKK